MDFRLAIAQQILSALPEAPLEAADVAAMLEVPPDTKLGDYAFPCFKLSKALRKSPVMIANQLAAAIRADFLARVESVRGYLNFFIDRAIYAERVLTAAEAQGLYYTLDENSGLSNGDTVTLTVHSNRDDFSDCIDKYGAMPQATEKTFTVEGLNEYVTSADTLSDSVLVSLQNQAEDVFKSYAAQRFSNGQTFKGMTYLGNYILTPKNKDSWGDKDRIVLAYQVTVHHDYTSELNTTYDADDSFFWYITFNNVSKDANDNIASGLNDYDTPTTFVKIDSGVQKYSFSSSTETWEYYGYASLDSLYNAAVNQYVENYNHQDNVA